MLTTKLEHAGFHILAATDGKKGLDVALKEHPDLIILDLLMPHMNGLEMLKQLRASDWGKTVPVVVATNVVDIPALNECLESGAEDYFVKSETELADLVRYINERLTTTGKDTLPMHPPADPM
jgi:DNA-binding response OmpR family regulator